jgi:prepilin-type processing-associated H-X9-DG protein
MFARGPFPIRFDDVRDGLSNTIMAGESLPSHSIHNVAFGPNAPIAGTEIPMNTMEGLGAAQTHQGQPQWRTQGFKSLHRGGANFLMGDGSVHFFSDQIDYKLYNNLGCRDDGEAGAAPPDGT